MYRVGIDMNVLASEIHCYYDEIVDVLQVITNSFFRMPGTSVADDKISGGTNGNLICYMTWKDELPIIPTNFNLTSNEFSAIIADETH